MLVEVYFGKVGFMREACLGSKWLRARGILPTKQSLKDSHEKVYQIAIDSDKFKIETLFFDLNVNPGKIDTDNFSPEDNGVWHQSMTIGDIVQYRGQAYMLNYSGLVELE
ncbi:MAG: hypothetical protein H8E18_15570 [FCB group bacterium]|nr:hypothetical protein [FCB group bacterium]